MESFSANREGLTADDTKSLPITVPHDVNVQRQITDDISSRSQTYGLMIDKARLSIEKITELRAALITAAVTGQIDVATWGKFGETDRRLDQIEEDMSLREARA